MIGKKGMDMAAKTTRVTEWRNVAATLAISSNPVHRVEGVCVGGERTFQNGHGSLIVCFSVNEGFCRKLSARMRGDGWICDG